MDIVIRVFAQQIDVCLQRVVYFHLGPVAVPQKRPRRSRVWLHHNHEIVNRHWPARHLLAGLQRHRRSDRRASRNRGIRSGACTASTTPASATTPPPLTISP